MSHTLDYSTNIINETMVMNGVKYCYTLYPELFQEEDQQLEPTGNVHVLAITPTGTQSFIIYSDGEVDTDQMSEVDKNNYNNLPLAFAKALFDDAEKIKARIS